MNRQSIIAVAVLFTLCISTTICADQTNASEIANTKIAYLDHGKLWLYDSRGPRILSDLWEHRDVKWLDESRLVVVEKGNIQLFDINTHKRQQLTSIGNIRNILVLPERKKIIFARLTGEVSECGYGHEICSVGITDKKITRIRKLWVNGDVEVQWVIIGGKIYYLDMIDADNQLVVYRSMLMRLDLSTAKVRSVYTTKQGNNFQTICRSWDQTRIVILGYEFQIHVVRNGNDTYQEYVQNSERCYIAQFELPKSELVILHRFGQGFPSSDEGIAGSCMLPDGKLVLGTRSFRGGNEGPEISKNALYLFDFETSNLTQIANGYRPDAISE